MACSSETTRRFSMPFNLESMPFKSKAQMRFLFATNPQLAKKWKEKYGVPKNLPQKKKSSKKK